MPNSDSKTLDASLNPVMTATYQQKRHKHGHPTWPPFGPSVDLGVGGLISSLLQGRHMTNLSRRPGMDFQVSVGLIPPLGLRDGTGTETGTDTGS